ncbi:ATP-binding cassette domain-containing protein [Pseudobacillus badius]|uniref:ATP-binding cassette domain-containing protein n=1 Tax=Bacillus badius TaxID=1455 RepID=UPI001CBEA873|nr:ATP-binding cassette domain-containing protein [Bacillus badius]UAT28989.1 ATP-binding cassette domain-containing protein [Bacillus badius]GLY12519.1 ABC transporter ATP-binding protein [Bacillus badius]
MQNRLVVENINFSYGKNKVLDNISFTAENGIIALLGNNGAGKTTLMNVLTGLKPAKHGKARLNDLDLLNTKEYPLHKVGYLPQNFNIYNNITGLDFLSYVYDLKNIKKSNKKTYIQEIVEKFHLGSMINQRVGKYSGGYKRRLGIAQAVLGQPPLIIIDEPTVGLDPEQRIEFRSHLSEISRDSITLISTHIIEDVELFSDKIVVLKNNTILFDGNVEEMISMCSPEIDVMETTRESLPQLSKKVTIIEEKRLNNDLIKVKFIKNDDRMENNINKEITLENAYVYLQKR